MMQTGESAQSKKGNFRGGGGEGEEDDDREKNRSEEIGP